MQDEDQGVQGLRPWLENIASCAPNSPVMIIGTHLDKCPRIGRDDRIRYLEGLIKKLHFDKKLGTYPIIANDKCYFIDVYNKSQIDELRRDIYNFVAEFIPSELAIYIHCAACLK